MSLHFAHKDSRNFRMPDFRSGLTMPITATYTGRSAPTIANWRWICIASMFAYQNNWHVTERSAYTGVMAAIPYGQQFFRDAGHQCSLPPSFPPVRRVSKYVCEVSSSTALKKSILRCWATMLSDEALQLPARIQQARVINNVPPGLIRLADAENLRAGRGLLHPSAR